MHIPHSLYDHNSQATRINKIQQLTLVFTCIASALLLSSCVDPYSSLYGESPTKIKEDADFLEGYKTSLCSIKEQHEYEEISRGRCLALYYDFKEQSHTKKEKEEIVKRVSYIMKDPGKVDQSILDQLSRSTAEIGACKEYITENCM